MINTLIGRKLDQTQKFLENGKRVPVTLISVTDNAVVQVKTLDKDTYTAVQLGFGNKKKANKPSLGHSKKAGFDKVSEIIREVRLVDGDTPNVGEYITLDSVFKPGDIITVTGTSKGKGFAGVVKRHGFRGGPKTHGQSDRERAPGSIGQTTTPGRVYRGKRMAGRMGSDEVTIENLVVISIDLENKILLVAGLVPGHKDSIVFITKVGEKKKFVPLLEDAEKAASEEAAAAKKAEEEAAIKAAEEEAKKVEEKVEEAPVENVEAEAKTEEPAEKVEEAASNAVKEEVLEDATSDVAESKEEEKK